MLTFSPAAIREIKRLQQSRQQPDTILELKVSSGGCSGLFYVLDLVSSPKSPSDRSIEIDGISVLVDSKSWQYIENLKVDYAEDLMGGGFRFNNPQAKQACGCGISFAPNE